MDILFEFLAAGVLAILEFLFSAIFQVMAEVLGLVVDARSLKSDRSQTIRRLAAIAALIVAGVLAGAIGLWLMPQLYLQSGWMRWANLLLAPLAAGALVQIWDNWRERADSPPPALPGFARGFLFMLIVTAMRFIWGE